MGCEDGLDAGINLGCIYPSVEYNQVLGLLLTIIPDLGFVVGVINEGLPRAAWQVPSQARLLIEP